MAGLEGIEPPTSGFGDRRSTSWSYSPAFREHLLPGPSPNLNYNLAAQATQKQLLLDGAASCPLPAGPSELSCLPVRRMLTAGRAILLQLKPFPVINLVLVGVVITALALGAGHRHHRSFVRRHCRSLALGNIKDGQAVPFEPHCKIAGNGPACKMGAHQYFRERAFHLLSRFSKCRVRQVSRPHRLWTLGARIGRHTWSRYRCRFQASALESSAPARGQETGHTASPSPDPFWRCPFPGRGHVGPA